MDSQDLDEVTSEICDFSLEEQNQFAESQGVKPSAPSDYVPILGKALPSTSDKCNPFHIFFDLLF